MNRFERAVDAALEYCFGLPPETLLVAAAVIILLGYLGSIAQSSSY